MVIIKYAVVAGVAKELGESPQEVVVLQRVKFRCETMTPRLKLRGAVAAKRAVRQRKYEAVRLLGWVDGFTVHHNSMDIEITEEGA